MKKKDLIKKLKQKGAVFIRHGANHELWESRSGKCFPVPRHNEIKEIMAEIIIKQADR